LFLLGLSFSEKNLIPTIHETVKKVEPFLTPSAQPSPTITFQKVQGASDSANLVIKVLDGDTLVMENGEKVRFIGVNSPETGQPYSVQSTQMTKEFVLGKVVRLETDTTPRDRYGRLLAYVYRGDRMINEELIRRGVAIVETIPPNVKYELQLKNAQRDARANCEGLWVGLCEDKSSTCIVIDTVHADAAGDDNKNKNDEWVSLHNTCNKNVNMTGFLLKDNSAGSFYIFPAFTLAPQKNVTIYSGCGQNAAEKLYWKCPEVRNSIWNNDSDTAYLYNEFDILISDFGY